jgi:hypothetical protein
MTDPDGSDNPSDPDDPDDFSDPGEVGDPDRIDGDGGLDGFPAGWEVWSDGEEKAVFVYRPDVFDAGEFPAACLPTIYVTRGRRERRPGTDLRSRPGEQWYVTLFLEPEVERDPAVRENRTAAIEAAHGIAARFARGEFDYRTLYQVPRDPYLDRLDELTGRTD